MIDNWKLAGVRTLTQNPSDSKISIIAMVTLSENITSQFPHVIVALPQRFYLFNDGAWLREEYHLLKELEQLRQSNSKSCCSSHLRMQEVMTNTAIIEEKEKQWARQTSYISDIFR